MKASKLTNEQVEEIKGSLEILAKRLTQFADTDEPSDVLGIILECPGAVFDCLDSQPMKLRNEA